MSVGVMPVDRVSIHKESLDVESNYLVFIDIVSVGLVSIDVNSIDEMFFD